jgi:hypothetical protein
VTDLHLVPASPVDGPPGNDSDDLAELADIIDRASQLLKQLAARRDIRTRPPQPRLRIIHRQQ